MFISISCYDESRFIDLSNRLLVVKCLHDSLLLKKCLTKVGKKKLCESTSRTCNFFCFLVINITTEGVCCSAICYVTEN